MVGILLDDGQDATRDDLMGPTKVMIDLCMDEFMNISTSPLSKSRTRRIPCRVRVMDCSNFSSSSVSERLREDIESARATRLTRGEMSNVPEVG